MCTIHVKIRTCKWWCDAIRALYNVFSTGYFIYRLLSSQSEKVRKQEEKKKMKQERREKKKLR